LTHACKKFPDCIKVSIPIEAYPGGKYRKNHDVLRPEVQEVTLADIATRGPQGVTQLGIDCSSFSQMNINMNGGSRSRDNPYGGKHEREIVGNKHAAFVVKCIRLILRVGGYFSVENPTSSYLWVLPSFKRLANHVSVSKTRLHQCEFGLTFPDCPEKRCQKDTIILSNVPELSCVPSVTNMYIAWEA